jgi:hypothetical protein
MSDIVMCLLCYIGVIVVVVIVLRARLMNVGDAMFRQKYH